MVQCFRAECTISHWSSSYELQVKGKLEESIELPLCLQKGRMAFGQGSIDLNTWYDSVSVAFGHKKTKTTELSYARRKEHHAFEGLAEAWLAPRTSIPAN